MSRGLMFSGRPPAGLEPVAILDDFEVYVLPARNDRWLNLKLVAMPGLRLRKGNYWVNWHKERQYVAENKDKQVMLTHAPALYDALLDLLPQLAAVKAA